MDQKKEPAIGATVTVEGMAAGAKTNMDGYFEIKGLADSSYTLIVSYVSFAKKKLEHVMAKAGIRDTLQIILEKETKTLKDVQIASTIKRESMQSLLNHQKNSAQVTDGISADMIKKTADRSTGDVLKRVSGVSIIENKFAVIRGLSDRYNLATLNGDLLPSSESDKKAFSFDVIPSAIIDRISITKTASADRPAEFAGGIIDVISKDIPTENFLTVQLGSGGNSITTGKEFVSSKKSSTDFLGFDHSVRVLPSNFPTTSQFYSTYSAFSKEARYEATRSMNNNWKLDRKSTVPLNQTISISGGISRKLSKQMKFGLTAALSYSRSYRLNSALRSDLIGVSGQDTSYAFQDTTYRENVLIGGLLNLGLKFNENHKLTFRNTYTSFSENQTILRDGNFIENQQYIHSNAAWYTGNQLQSHSLQGEHSFGKRKIKWYWNAVKQSVIRNTPDLRKYYAVKNYDDSVYRAYIPAKGSPFYSGTFFSKTKENIDALSTETHIPYSLFNSKQQIRLGAFFQKKDRIYDARVLGYKISNQTKYIRSIETLSQEDLFSAAHVGENGIVIEDITQPSDHYEASSNLWAAYLLSDNHYKENWRLSYGVRMEKFQQKVTTGNLKQGDQVIEKSNTNFLPSINLTYSPDKKTNLRLAGSQTLSRPEFRELANSAFYNYNMQLTYTGNDQLQQTVIRNLDLRAERFPGKGEMHSISLFYKKFSQAIEATMIAGTKGMTYQNAPTAYLYGGEAEFRKSLSFLSNRKKSVWNDITWFGNIALIHSQVQLTSKAADSSITTSYRPLQGQSPYVINTGFSYQNNEKNIGITLIYNRIGERIIAVGNTTYVADLYEAPRNLLDLQLSKRFKNKLEVKLSFSDILANNLVYYYNGNDRLSFQKKNDFQFLQQRQGRNMSVSFSYSF